MIIPFYGAFGNYLQHILRFLPTKITQKYLKWYRNISGLVIIDWWRPVFKGLIFGGWTKGRQLKGSIKATIWFLANVLQQILQKNKTVLKIYCGT